MNALISQYVNSHTAKYFRGVSMLSQCLRGIQKRSYVPELQVHFLCDLHLLAKENWALSDAITSVQDGYHHECAGWETLVQLGLVWRSDIRYGSLMTAIWALRNAWHHKGEHATLFWGPGELLGLFRGAFESLFEDSRKAPY